MKQRPHRITDYLSTESALNSLLRRDRSNQALLLQVRQHLPSPLAEHCVATVLDANQLLIYVDSSTWSSRLRFLSRNLGLKLQEAGLKVTKITVRVHLERQHKIRKRHTVRQLSTENAQLIEQTAKTIADPALADALRRLCRHKR